MSSWSEAPADRSFRALDLRFSDSAGFVPAGENAATQDFDATKSPAEPSSELRREQPGPAAQPVGSERMIAASAVAGGEGIRAQAYAEGLEAGRAELPWRDAEEVGRTLEALGKVLEDAKSTRRRFIESARVEAIALTAELVERLIRKELRADSQVWLLWVREACAQLPADETPVVHLSPEDEQAIRTHLQSKLGDAELAEFSLRADSSLAPGCARLEAGDIRRFIDPAEVAQRVREELLPLAGAGIPGPETDSRGGEFPRRDQEGSE